jgi:uncharacterized protein
VPVEARDEYLPTTSRDVPGWFGLLRSQARQSPQYGSPTQSSEDGRSKDSPHARPASADRSGSRPQITIRNTSEGLSKTTGFSPAGNEALILLAIHQGLVHPCFSEDILEEYAAVLARAKFAFPPDEIAALCSTIRVSSFQPDVSGPVSSDPADTKFLHCAQAAQADYIVTGNKRHFPDAPYGVTQVLSAGELLDQITFEI